ncbi:hypothetical protein CSUI_005978 [Cystoisospora suis]|uniref:Uncharacterized protein n=1 Tax=Cystoisospora suis TaxID=483139 RepID=A0A2C6K332_9APIC|nr:hypothetical protein CSUI_005978 [Cystoisospora suis]
METLLYPCTPSFVLCFLFFLRSLLRPCSKVFLRSLSFHGGEKQWPLSGLGASVATATRRSHSSPPPSTHTARYSHPPTTHSVPDHEPDYSFLACLLEWMEVYPCLRFFVVLSFRAS